MGKFEGQVVLITGASYGLGAALADAFSREGANTVLVARSVGRIEELARKLNFGGSRSIAVEGDVTRDGDMERAVGRARAEFGQLDVVVANAGFFVNGPFLELTIEDHRRQLETNLFGALRTLYAALPEVQKRRGRIVVIGSLLGMFALPGDSAYCMSKFALAGLADALALELAPAGVSVTHVVPGNVATGIYQVDNRGVRQKEEKWQPPQWLIMPADQAARQIVSAVHRRKHLCIITKHAKAIIFFQRHFSGIVHSALKAIRKSRAKT